MPLAGTFDVLDFAGALTLLSRRSCTGQLHVKTSHSHGSIRFYEGLATGAVCLEGARSESHGNWRRVLDDLCFETLRAGRGSFEFIPEEVEAPTGAKVKLETVLGAARMRLEEWREVEDVIPSLDAVPRLAEGLQASSVTLDQDHWRLLVTIDGRRSLLALARRLEMTNLRVCQLIKPLVENGAVAFGPAGTTLRVPPVKLDAELQAAQAAQIGAGPERAEVMDSGASMDDASVRNGNGLAPNQGQEQRRAARSLASRIANRQASHLRVALVTPAGPPNPPPAAG